MASYISYMHIRVHVIHSTATMLTLMMTMTTATTMNFAQGDLYLQCCHSTIAHSETWPTQHVCCNVVTCSARNNETLLPLNRSLERSKLVKPIVETLKGTAAHGLQSLLSLAAQS